MTFLSDSFKAQLKQITARAPHALLIEGVQGNPATTEVLYVAELLSKHQKNNLQIIEKPVDKTVITIEQMQQLYRTTRAKKKSDQQAIIAIPYANDMSEAAQNAFLKLLEEPPKHTHFILGTGTIGAVLQTIRSRCYIVHAKPFEPVGTKHKLLQEYQLSEAEATQLLFLAKGSPTRLSALLKNSDLRTTQLTIAANAKLFLAAPMYQKIVLASQLANKRDEAVATIATALDMLVVMAPARATDTTLQKQLGVLQKTYAQLRANGNVRLQLLRAALSM